MKWLGNLRSNFLQVSKQTAHPKKDLHSVLYPEHSSEELYDFLAALPLRRRTLASQPPQALILTGQPSAGCRHHGTFLVLFHHEQHLGNSNFLFSTEPLGHLCRSHSILHELEVRGMAGSKTWQQDFSSYCSRKSYEFLQSPSSLQCGRQPGVQCELCTYQPRRPPAINSPHAHPTCSHVTAQRVSNKTFLD